MNRRFSNFLVALAWALSALGAASGALAAAAPGGDEPPADLLSHGAGPLGMGIDPVWVARIQTEPAGPRSTIVYRERPDAEWIQLSSIPARVVGLTHHGSDLIVLLNDPAGRTRWAWMSAPSRFAYGPALPHADILAMAGNRTSLWALGVPNPPAPATLPATTPLTTPAPSDSSAPPAATPLTISDPPAPAAAPAQPPALPRLYRYERGAWQLIGGDWPDDAPSDFSPPNTSAASADPGPGDSRPAPSRPALSMQLVDGLPVVAVASGQTIHLLRHEGGSWRKLSAAEAGSWQRFKLIGLANRPALWVQPRPLTDSAGTIWVDGEPAFELTLSGPLPRGEDLTLCATAAMLHVIFQRDQKLLDQHFTFAGAASGEPTEILWRPPARHGAVESWLTIGIMAVLTILILNSVLRRRSTPREEDRDEGG